MVCYGSELEPLVSPARSSNLDTLCCLVCGLLRQLEHTSFFMWAEWEELMLSGQKNCAKYFKFTYLQNYFAFKFIVP